MVGTDGSHHATRAARWAVGEAAARRRPLRIVCATATAPAPADRISPRRTACRSTVSRKVCWERPPHSHADWLPPSL
ncbi:universal stress protein [Streptomyces sp. NBC_00046]|uniref:universal stress protein n=1 Tax=Streptomyces sp. NBC_00046 TaxID=2975626 RepID=UPI00386F653D